jgi:hypothetical protein
MSAESTTTADQALIAKHRAMWATGGYPKLASDLVTPLGPALVDASGIGPGDRVLDVTGVPHGSSGSALPAYASTSV